MKKGTRALMALALVTLTFSGSIASAIRHDPPPPVCVVFPDGIVYCMPSGLKTTVVISSTSLAKPDISITVYNNGNTAVSELVSKVSVNDFHFVKKTDKSSP